MKYIAHKTEDGAEQLLKDHLYGVSEKCRDYAIDGFKEYAALCGLLHDIGKIQPSFQKRINGAPVRIGHAVCGAKELHKQKPTLYRDMLEYCIAGHHSGLPDGGEKNHMPEDATLHGILKRDTEDYSAYLNEISITYPDDNMAALFDGVTTQQEIIELYAFFTRYMYSCLTDADFIDTEEFFHPEIKRGITGDFKEAYNRVCAKLDALPSDTLLQKTRSKIQNQVYENIKSDSNIYAINMPTGSGKTLCSIKAALKTAIEQGKKRIIYVIPFVSVIEQTAQIFEEIFGDVLPVLQHHSNYDFDKADEADSENDFTSEKLRRTCENWDSQLVITTNIQFFESVYHCKSSRLRKLHNMADSVIVFDEVHMLPVDYIQPCLRAIAYITKYLHSTAFIMSATMPNYDEYIPAKVESVIHDKSDFVVFKKCRYEYIGKQSLESIAERVMTEKRALVIVNSKKSARELYKLCKEAYDGETVHLSTNMTPIDRTAAIDRIKRSLKNETPTLAISTSLIEAGVDLDFDSVYRENAGLDNILQAGGRCNREGKRDSGLVYIFETDGGLRDIQMKSNITRGIFNDYDDISDEKCISDYYSRLFAYEKERIESHSLAKYMGEKINFDKIPFRTYAAEFNMIDNDTISVVIPCSDNARLIDSLRHGALSVKRRLQQYSASVRYRELEEMQNLGMTEEISGVIILSNTDYYDREIGLKIDTNLDYIM